MIPIRFSLLLLVLLSGARALSLPVPPSLPCTLTMTPVSVRGVSYLASLAVSPGCSASRMFRVRKSSTLNVRSEGAPYQPIRPDGSPAAAGLFSWSISKASSTIPRGELWTSFTWDWQYYDADAWNVRLREFGAWRRIPQRMFP